MYLTFQHPYYAYHESSAMSTAVLILITHIYIPNTLIYTFHKRSTIQNAKLNYLCLPNQFGSDK